jgi:hypothetical protein
LAHAINRVALTAARGKHLLFLHEKTEILSGFFKGIQTLNNKEDIGIIGR